MRATGEPDSATDAIARDRVAYTVDEAARLMSLSVRKVRYMLAAGQLESFKVGKARRIHGRAIEEYVRKQTGGAA